MCSRFVADYSFISTEYAMLILKLLVATGTLMILSAACYLVAVVLGWLPPINVADDSGLRPIASIAVAGCLAAAVGCFFLEREQEP